MFSYLLVQATRAFKYPDKTYNFAMRKVKEALFWESYYDAIREPKVKCAVPRSSEVYNEILKGLKDINVNLINFKIDLSDYIKYRNDAEYYKFPTYYGGGKADNFVEKTLEHYLAAKILNLSEDDIYIDVATNNSPTPEIYQKLYDCQVYKQDKIFPKGIDGNVIGGDAGHMPVKDNFATKMALHDALQCFEEDSDIRFIKEASRVLRKGGNFASCPYIFLLTMQSKQIQLLCQKVV